MTSTAKQTVKFELHIGEDYLEIQREDMGILKMNYPNVHDKKLTAYIVKCLNAHEDLVEALKYLRDEMRAAEWDDPDGFAKVDAALAKAGAA